MQHWALVYRVAAITGKERDGGTVTLDYFNARHYAARLGSFTQPDKMNAGGDIMNPQSWNAYGYVLGNPLRLVDPSGMYAEASPQPPSDFPDGPWNAGQVGRFRELPLWIRGRRCPNS